MGAGIDMLIVLRGVGRLVQQAANDEAFVNESDLQLAACQAIEKIFSRVEHDIEEIARRAGVTLS